MAPKPRAPASKRRAPNPNALFSEEEPGVGTKRDALKSGPGAGSSSLPPSSPSAVESTQHFKTDLGVDAKLVVEKGMHAGKVLKLGAGTVVIGRSSKCDLSLKGSPGVSRRHTKVQLVDDRYVVLDLESRNGTIVNGKQVMREFLNDGDVVEVCDEHIRFVAQGGGKGAPAPIADIEDRPTQLLGQTVPRAPPATRNSRPPPLPAKRRPSEPFVDKTAANDGLAGFDAPSALSAQQRPPPETRTHFVDVPRDIDDGTRTAPLAQPRPSDLDEPVGQPDLDDDSLAPPPRVARAGARAAELSSPYVHGTQLQRRGGLSAMHVLAALATLVVLALGAAAADTFVGPRLLLRWLNGGALPDETTAEPVEGAHAAASSVDAQAKAAAEAKAAEQAKAAQAAIDAEAAEAKAAEQVKTAAEAKAAEQAKEAEAKAAAPTKTAGAVVEVKAATAGRIARVALTAGDQVKASGAVAWLEGGGNPKKLAALREEERDFAAAAKKGNQQAERDLEAVRASIAELERSGRGRALPAGQTGTVVEVLVKAGDKVEAGQVIARVQLPGS